MRARPIVAVTADRILRGAHPNHTAGRICQPRSSTAPVRLRSCCPRSAPPAGRCDCRGSRRLAVHRQLFERRAASLRRRRERARHAARPARDATALPLIRAAIDAGVPVLAICRGMQELNVAYGGTLHQRLHATTGFDDHRERPADPLERQYGPAHVVQFAPGGLLQRVARGAHEATVNSLHDWGIAQLGAGRRRSQCARRAGRGRQRARRARVRARRAVASRMALRGAAAVARHLRGIRRGVPRARMTHRIHAAGGAMPLPAASDVD